MLKLYGPLNSLGYIYRSINQNLVDTERLMKLLDESPEVNDKPDASTLQVASGEIEFGVLVPWHRSFRHGTFTVLCRECQLLVRWSDTSVERCFVQSPKELIGCPRR